MLPYPYVTCVHTTQQCNPFPQFYIVLETLSFFFNLPDKLLNLLRTASPSCLIFHLGDEKDSGYICHIALSTLRLTKNEHTFRLRQLAAEVNVGDYLWQKRAQALSQEVCTSLDYH